MKQMHPSPAALAPPVAVGGLGGSGTRIVARLLHATGIHTGDDLNAASDTLWFTLLFKWAGVLDCDEARFDLLTQALVGALRGGAPLPESVVAQVEELTRLPHFRHPDWLRQRAQTLLASAAAPAHGRWGWKEPNTHLLIERFWARIPDLRYVHVVRNGLDMAYSSNQNQLRHWGARVLGKHGPITPARSLAFWCATTRRMHELAQRHPGRIYWLDYDALCADPDGQLPPLCTFLGASPEAGLWLRDQVQARPARHDVRALQEFAADDLAFVRAMGYAVG